MTSSGKGKREPKTRLGTAGIIETAMSNIRYHADDDAQGDDVGIDPIVDDEVDVGKNGGGEERKLDEFADTVHPLDGPNDAEERCRRCC